MKLHWDEHPGSGPWLLLVHGMLSSRAQWRPNLEALSRVARPVVVELWGHGRSPAPEDPARYHPDAYVESFEELREELGAESWLLCGQSFGAAFTLRYALDHPDRVIAQVFTNSISALADEEWIARVRAGVVAQSEAIVRGGLAAIEQFPIHPLHAKRLPPESREALLGDAGLLDPRGVAATLRYTTPEASVRDRIAENRVPTLLVCGERESRFADHRQLAEKTMTQLEIVDIPAGHAVNIEAADAFNAAVVGFFSRSQL